MIKNLLIPKKRIMKIDLFKSFREEKIYKLHRQLAIKRREIGGLIGYANPIRIKILYRELDKIQEEINRLKAKRK